MHFVIKTTPDELKRARKWWQDLEMQWKFAYNEAVFGKGTVLEPPKDDELMALLIGVDALRFAGPLAPYPNMSVSLTNLSGLIPLYNLTFLTVSHTGISSLKELTRHTRLKSLFVFDNQLTSIEGIEGMLQLEELYLQNNLVTDLSPIQKLTNLRTLYVVNNRLTRINGLTEAHADRIKRFYVQPNNELPDRELIRVQNELGILCRKG
jgi:hypothetical protein